VFFSNRVHLCSLTHALGGDGVLFVLIYDILKANDPVFDCHFKLDDLLSKPDVFNLKLTVVFFYFLGVLKNFIHLLVNVRLLGVYFFRDPEFATLDDKKMACLLSLREQVGTFD